jgi:hypothetical protein
VGGEGARAEKERTLNRFLGLGCGSQQLRQICTVPPQAEVPLDGQPLDLAVLNRPEKVPQRLLHALDAALSVLQLFHGALEIKLFLCSRGSGAGRLKPAHSPQGWPRSIDTMPSATSAYL